MAEPVLREPVLDLRALDVVPGGARTVTMAVPLAAVRVGGQEYRFDPGEPVVRMEVARSLSGLHLRLRARAAVVGPCFRCLEDARAELAVDAREYAAKGRPGDVQFDDDLDCEYLAGHELCVADWTRDALLEALPVAILCTEGCQGLCPVCGQDRNRFACGCMAEAAPDPRLAPLAGLAERLRHASG